jgi:hypothetical protein
MGGLLVSIKCCSDLKEEEIENVDIGKQPIFKYDFKKNNLSQIERSESFVTTVN